jgi:hypothetical protein
MCLDLAAAGENGAQKKRAACSKQGIPKMQTSKTVRRLGLAGCSALAMLAVGGVAAADPLATPAISPPLAANPEPTKLDGGPLGDIYVGGVVSGYGYAQNHKVGTDSSTRGDISNAQVWVQKTDGPLQFYAQFGGYSIPVVEIPYTKASDNTKNTFGLLPQGWVTWAPASNFSVQVGKLPTLYGAEYTYTFQNTNIQRGINWNQENAVNRGVQANYSNGPFALSVSLNDGFYSNRYSWVTAAATFKVNPENTLVISGGANLSKSTSGGSPTATPIVQNNQEIIDVIWTYSKGPLTLTPYFQYNHVPDIPELGIKAASTIGVSLLGKYSVSPEFSWGFRGEYMSSSKGGGVTSMNFFGPGADVWTATITPTYQKGAFFARAEASYVHLSNYTAGFGQAGDRKGQLRGVLEVGFLF